MLVISSLVKSRDWRTRRHIEQGGGGREEEHGLAVCDLSETCTETLEEMETMLALKEVLGEKLKLVAL